MRKYFVQHILVLLQKIPFNNYTLDICFHYKALTDSVYDKNEIFRQDECILHKMLGYGNKNVYEDVMSIYIPH